MQDVYWKAFYTMKSLLLGNYVLFFFVQHFIRVTKVPLGPLWDHTLLLSLLFLLLMQQFYYIPEVI